MSLNKNQEFMRELDYCKEVMWVWGTNFDINDISFALRLEVKDCFPINGVPEHIVKSLDALDFEIKSVLDRLVTTVDRIINEVEKIDGLESKREQ